MIDNEYAFPSLNSKVYEMIECKAYELFEDLQLNNIPIDPFDIVKKKGYELVPFSKLGQCLLYYYLGKGIDGISYYDKEKKTFIIHYDDSVIIERQRFTIMHEMGHITLGHRDESDLANQMANCFASYSLSPSPLIMFYNCEDYIDVARIFDVSLACAMVSFKRYMSWNIRDGKIKDYEIKLIELFGK